MVVKSKVKLCYSFIPARIVFVFLGFLGLCLDYTYKVVLSVAIISMAGHSVTNESELHECYNSSGGDNTILGDFNDWDDHKQAIILSGFFYGYIWTQIPAGILAERFGAKWILGGGLLIAAILSLLGPVAAKTHYILFIVTRIGQGLAQGVVFPCMNALIAKWMPKMERSRGTTIIFSGAQIGTIITMPLAAALCQGTFLDGWPAIFYILGTAGCVWFVLWAIFVFENPDSHPHISQKEYDYITSNQGEKTSKVSFLNFLNLKAIKLIRFHIQEIIKNYRIFKNL
jgi:ACS family sodium-dependent inorganic phosphate cotransporter-like MFS transporter 5